MYLSRVEIDFENRKKTADLNHLGAYHNWVERLFPEEISKGERGRKLWRVDKLGGKHYLLVVSEKSPCSDKFNMYGVEGTAQIKQYSPFLESLQNGQKLRFRLTCNPVKSISSGKESGKRGRVVPHVTTFHQMEFLKERADKNGFALQDDEFYVAGSDVETIKKAGNKPQTLLKVTYEGVLLVTDVALFRELLTSGLGKKKAYGCGMMTVIPGA